MTTAEVAVFDTTDAAAPSKDTEVMNARLVPVNVTEVPPEVPPTVTESVLTVGAAA